MLADQICNPIGVVLRERAERCKLLPFCMDVALRLEDAQLLLDEALGVDDGVWVFPQLLDDVGECGAQGRSLLVLHHVACAANFRDACDERTHCRVIR